MTLVAKAASEYPVQRLQAGLTLHPASWCPPRRQGKLAVAHVAPVVSVDAAVVAVWLWLYTGFPGPSKACLQDESYFSWHDAKTACYIATVQELWQDKIYMFDA